MFWIRAKNIVHIQKWLKVFGKRFGLPFLQQQCTMKTYSPILKILSYCYPIKTWEWAACLHSAAFQCMQLLQNIWDVYETYEHMFEDK